MRIHSRAMGLSAALALVVVLSGCTGGTSPEQPQEESTSTGQSSASATNETVPAPEPEPTGKSPEQVSSEIFAAIDAAPAIAEVTGQLESATTAKSIDARISIESIEAGETSTVLKFTLYSQGGAEVGLPLDTFNEFRPLTKDIRDVAIVDVASAQRFTPYLGVADKDNPEESSFCLCSTAPKTINATGFPLYATFPPIGPDSTSVTVSIPGFKDIEGVPVKRS